MAGPGGYVNASSQTGLHPQTMPIREGRTPPPHTQGQSEGTQTGAAVGAGRGGGGMSIRDIVDGGRSAADSNMLSSLNRRAM